MTKRRLFCWSLILLILAAFAVWLEPTRVVWGWLRREAFYQGRPTSWWRNEIAQWKCVGCVGIGFGSTWFYKREPSAIEKVASRFVALPEKAWPTLLDGDDAGREVLQALMRDRDPRIGKLAEEGLKRHNSTERGPSIIINDGFIW